MTQRTKSCIRRWVKENVKDEQHYQKWANKLVEWAKENKEEFRNQADVDAAYHEIKISERVD